MTIISTRRSALLVLLLSIGLSSKAQDQNALKEDARKSAESWLTLIDNGQYGESWDEAAEAFRSKITKENWTNAVKGVRERTGKAGTRKLVRADYTTTLPNAPAGEYVVMQYENTFQTWGPSIETIVPARDGNGKWKVSGYFVKPKN